MCGRISQTISELASPICKFNKRWRERCRPDFGLSLARQKVQGTENGMVGSGGILPLPPRPRGTSGPHPSRYQQKLPLGLARTEAVRHLRPPRKCHEHNQDPFLQYFAGPCCNAGSDGAKFFDKAVRAENRSSVWRSTWHGSVNGCLYAARKAKWTRGH